MAVLTALQARVTIAPTEATGTRSASDIAASLSSSHKRQQCQDSISQSVITFVVIGLVALFVLVFVTRIIYICRTEKITLKEYFSTCCGRRDKKTRHPKERSSNAVPPPIPVHLPGAMATTSGDGVDAYGRRDVKDPFSDLPGYDGLDKDAPPSYPMRA
ncbi:hypothetical protein DL96DRAFT_471791 [Flagelloscypha sp. PMI_526]|nr:hypothetical protein DL96DRAFT_471791 [Flagelloscypha sp. PMI_526]